MANCNVNFDDKQMLGDALNSQKFVAGQYNCDLLECATPELKRCLWGILEDEHSIQEEIFTEMSNRGYYPVEKAKEEKINETKQKYGQCVTA